MHVGLSESNEGTSGLMNSYIRFLIIGLTLYVFLPNKRDSGRI